MKDTGSNIIFFDGKAYYQLLDIQLKSFVNLKPLEDIKASREAGKKFKPWFPEEENSLYIRPPTNNVFVANYKKHIQALLPGSNEVKLPTKSLESNLIDLQISWHGKEGTLSVKGLRDTTLKKQTSSEYFEDIVPSIKRDDLAAQAICIAEIIIPLNTKSFQEINGYEKLTRVSVHPLALKGRLKNEPYISEHPSDIIIEGNVFKNKYISVLIFVHMGTGLAPWTIEKLRDELVIEPITITNIGHKGSINFSVLVRILGDVDEDEIHPIIFSVKSSDLAKQIFFEVIKYGV